MAAVAVGLIDLIDFYLFIQGKIHSVILKKN